MNKTMKDLAREALAVQDACNLSGVAHGFARALGELRTLLPSAGTDAINSHPVAVLWADKVALPRVWARVLARATREATRLIP